MRVVRARVLAPALALCLLTQPVSLSGQSRDQEAVQAVIARYVQCLNTHDLEAVVGLFVPTGEVLPPGVPPVVGADAVRARYQGLFASEILNVRFTPVETVVSGDYAFARLALSGTFTMKSDSKAQAQDAKALMLFRRTATGWKITHYMANNNEAS